MYQSLVEGREVPWSLLVKDVPEGQAPGPRLHRRAARLGEERRHALQGAQLPGADRRRDAQRRGLRRPLDRLRHGRRRAALQRQGTDGRAGREVHAARTRARAAGSPCRAAAAWASCTLQTPAMIRFGEETEDEVFITHEAATAGVEIENTGSEPLVGLRYFGPDVHKNLPQDRRLSQVVPGMRRSHSMRATASYLHTDVRHRGRIHMSTCQQFSQTSQRRLAGRRRQGPRQRAADRPRHDARPDGRGRGRRRASSTASTCSCSSRTSSIDATDDELEAAGRQGPRAQPGRSARSSRRSGRRPAAARRWATRPSARSSSTQVRKGCRIAKQLRELGVRPYGVVRIDSACGVGDWAERSRRATSKRIAETFREACDDRRGPRRAAGRRRRNLLGRHAQLAADGAAAGDWSIARRRSAFRPTWPTRCSTCWATTRRKIAILPAGLRLERHGRRSTRPTRQLTDALRPWTIDFHVAQNDATVHGSGSHDKTGRHCLPNDPNGKLDIVKVAGFWLRDDQGELTQKFQHICWDGCMFPTR